MTGFKAAFNGVELLTPGKNTPLTPLAIPPFTPKKVSRWSF